MRSNFRGNERMVPAYQGTPFGCALLLGNILEKKVKVMSKFESNVQYIKYLVNKECASRFFNGELDKEINMEKGDCGSDYSGTKGILPLLYL